MLLVENDMNSVILFATVETTDTQGHHKSGTNPEKIFKVYSEPYICRSDILDYKSRLIKLDLLPLMNWLEFQDVIFAVRCLQKPVDNFNKC